MKRINKIFEVSELIAAELSNKISVTDQKILQEWVNRSDRNKAIYQKIVDQENLAKRNREYHEVDVKSAWNEISGKLNVKSRKRPIVQLSRYAAAILLPLVLGILAYVYFNSGTESISQEVAEITPGSSNAVLVMANGENIDLVTDSIVKIKEDDGTIINNSNEQLSYIYRPEKAKNKLLMNTLIVPRGGEYSLLLADGTKVFLNSMSKLVFPVNFTGDTREVTLEGEAYFQVAKDKTKPFIVTVQGIQVEVLGTSFNIKAYPDENQSYTTLVEGKVRLNSFTENSESFFLEPNHQAVFNPAISKMDIMEVDAAQVVQWISGRYTFKNQTLDEIMKTLSRWYDFTYSYEDESLKELRFEGGLNKYESIYPILDIISTTRKLKVSIEGKEVLFSRK